MTTLLLLGTLLQYTSLMLFFFVFMHKSNIRFLQRRLVSFIGANIASVSVAGIRIGYLVRNPPTMTSSVSPTVVLVHGITIDKYDWLPLIRRLPRHWKIIALDLPGHGDSGFDEEDDYSTVGVNRILHQVCELG